MPKKKYIKELSYFEVNSYLKYKKGRLYWKKRTSKCGPSIIGHRAGSISKDSFYPRIMIHKASYMQHRIIYLLHHRYCPEIVTVIDKTLTDEGVYNISIENLQEMNHSHLRNSSNTRVGKSSKYRGVCYCKKAKKYRVRVSVNGVRKSYGQYDKEIDAAKRYDEIAKKLIGEDAQLNFN